MFPVLFHIGSIPIHTYGLMIALGFLAAIWIYRREAPRQGLPTEPMIDLAFSMLFVGFIGARILFVITKFDDYWADPIEIFKVWNGGLVFYGGLVLAIFYVGWKLRKLGVPIWKGLDFFAPGLALAHAFGRMGCIAAGCCYGRPTGTSFGFKFHSELVDHSLWDIPLHPTQAYEAVGLLIIFAGLLYVNRHKRFDGQAAVTYLLTYPVLRSVVEIYRGDLVRGFVFDGLLSTSQFISVLVFISGLFILFSRLKTVRE